MTDTPQTTDEWTALAKAKERPAPKWGWDPIGTVDEVTHKLWEIRHQLDINVQIIERDHPENAPKPIGHTIELLTQHVYDRLAELERLIATARSASRERGVTEPTRTEGDDGTITLTLGNFEAVTTKGPQLANYHTVIQERDYKGLVIGLCNQNGNYPWQARSLLIGLNHKTALPAPRLASEREVALRDAVLEVIDKLYPPNTPYEKTEKAWTHQEYTGAYSAAGNIRDAIRALSVSQPIPEAGGATHRHKKRGTEYVLIGVGKMQVEKWMYPGVAVNHSVDMREVAIYRSVDDGTLWVRPIEEFNDGRFEEIAPSPQRDLSPGAGKDADNA